MSEAPDSADLSEFDDAFAKAEVEDMTSEVPDGRYQAVIERVSTKQTKETKRPMIVWQLRILGPTHRNRKLWRNNVVTAETVGRIKRDLLLCGVKIDRLSDLIFHVQELQGTGLEIQVKTNGDHQNVYFNKVLAIDPTITGGSVSGDDVLPF
jgi:hypothetical protein